ncbi:hypothetical protein BC938DRAFT_474125, partial [Jimgerdemannia flammicorona]
MRLRPVFVDHAFGQFSLIVPAFLLQRSPTRWKSRKIPGRRRKGTGSITKDCFASTFRRPQHALHRLPRLQRHKIRLQLGQGKTFRVHPRRWRGYKGPLSSLGHSWVEFGLLFCLVPYYCSLSPGLGPWLAR